MIFGIVISVRRHYNFSLSDYGAVKMNELVVILILVIMARNITNLDIYSKLKESHQYIG